MDRSVVDPDFELRRGSVLFLLPRWLFFFQSFLLFFTQNKGPGPSPRSATTADTSADNSVSWNTAKTYNIESITYSRV